MKKHYFLISLSTLIISNLAFARHHGIHEPHENLPGPCKQIVEACEKAGFVKGEAAKGNGLLKDCINPIMENKPAPANAARPLPTTVPADVINECKAKHPMFGHLHDHHHKKMDATH